MGAQGTIWVPGMESGLALQGKRALYYATAVRPPPPGFILGTFVSFLGSF